VSLSLWKGGRRAAHFPNLTLPTIVGPNRFVKSICEVPAWVTGAGPVADAPCAWRGPTVLSISTLFGMDRAGDRACLQSRPDGGGGKRCQASDGGGPAPQIDLTNRFDMLILRCRALGGQGRGQPRGPGLSVRPVVPARRLVACQGSLVAVWDEPATALAWQPDPPRWVPRGPRSQ